MTDLLEQAVAEAYAHVEEKSVVETVAEELVRLSAVHEKIRYKSKVLSSGDTSFNVSLGFKRLGRINVSPDGWVHWYTGAYTGDWTSGYSREPGKEAVQAIAKEANKRMRIVPQSARTSGGGLSRAFSDSLSGRREDDPALDAIVRGLDVLKSLGAPGNSFSYTADCSDMHRTCLRTSTGDIEVVKEGEVGFTYPNGKESAPIMRPTQAKILELLGEVARIAHNNGQIIPPNQSLNQQQAKRVRPKLIKGPQ